MSLQWECLVTKKIGDDVSGDFASNAGVTRFNGVADFADDMSDYNGDQVKFDTNWVPQDSAQTRGDPVTDVIDFIQNQGNADDDSISFDLWSQGIFPSDTTWTLRWEWVVTNQLFTSGNNEAMCFCLKSTALGQGSTPNPGTNGDWIGFTWTSNTAGGFMRLQASNNAGFFPIQGFNNFPTLSSTFSQPYTFYMELKRTSAIACECTMYLDSLYTQIFEKVRAVVPANVTNLRYLTLSNEIVTPSAFPNNCTGTIDDVTFFNNTEGTVDTFVLHGDELGVGSEFNPGLATKVITGADDGNWSVGGGPSVTGGVVSGWGADATWRRATYDMLGNDGITLDDNNWTIDFEFLRSDNDGNPSHSPFALVDTVSVAYNIDPTNNVAPFPQNGIVMHYGLNVVNGHKVSLYYRKEVSGDFGSGFTIQSPDSQSIPMAQNVQFYMRMMRINGTKYVLEVFTNSTRTALLGSIVVIAPDDTLSTLTWIMSSTNTTGGSGRILNGTVGDIQIFNGVSGQFVGGIVLDDDFSTYGEPVNPDFVDVFDSATGWTTTDFTRARIEDDQGFLFFMTVADATNDAIAFDLGAIVNPIDNVIFTDDFTTYADQGSADSAWPTTDVTRFRVNITNDNLDFNINTVAPTNLAISHDLGAGILNNEWKLNGTIRFSTITPDTNTRVYFGLSSTDHNTAINASADRIMILIRTSSGFLDYGSLDTDGTGETGLDNTVAFTFLTGVDYFLTVQRDSATTYHVEVFTDSGRTISLGQATGTCPATLENLRYIIMSNVNSVDTPTLVGTFDDIEVFDNSQTVSDTEWLLRFKASITEADDGASAQNKTLFWGLFSEDQTSNASNAQDGIFGMFFLESGQNGWLVKTSVNTGPEGAGSPTRISELGIITERNFYCELARVSSDTIRGSLYADANYSDLIFTGTVTDNAGGDAIDLITNLRYLKFMNDVTENGAGTLDVTIDDVCFWNGRSTSCDSGGDVVDPTFFDDFSTYTSQGEADTAWVPQVANQQVNIVTDVLDFVTRRDGVDNRCTHDLGAGNVSDTLWSLRWKYHVDPQILTSSVGAGTLLQIQNTDVAQNSQDDMLGFGLQNNVGVAGNRWLLLGKNGGATSGIADSGDNSVSLDEADYYLELVRLTATDVRARVFNNSDFTDLAFELNIVTSVANINLRYLIISSASDVTGWNGTLTGFIDNVQFWNNQVIQDGVISPWVSTDTSVLFVDPCAENLVYVSEQAGAIDDIIYFDLESALSDSKFVCRFTWFIQEVVQGADADNQNMFIQLQSLPVGTNTLKDSIGIGFRLDQNDDTFEIWAEDGASTLFVDTLKVATSQDTLFIEVIRESPTLQRLSFFSDPDYTFLISTFTQAIPATLTGLRYFVINKQVGGLNDHISSGHIDDVKVWDGVDVADSFDARRYLQLVGTTINPTSSLDRIDMRFNLDAGANYAFRQSFDDGADSANPSATKIRIQAGAIQGENRFFDVSIHNTELDEKLAQDHMTHANTPGPANVPDRSEVVGKWVNEITKVSRIQIEDDKAFGVLLDTDTEAVVFGSE